MKNFLFAVLFLLSTASYAQFPSLTYPKPPTYNSSKPTYGYGTNPNVRQQNGYIKNDGTYVKGHVKTQSNNTNWDNLSTKPNYNPYNGTTGTKPKDYSSGASSYGQGKAIHIGPQGGQYYYNSKGNKTYVPKRSPY